MKKLLKLGLSSLAAVSLITTSALAVTTSSVSSSSASSAAGGVLGLVFVALYCGCYLLVCLLVIFAIVFDIMMILDVSKRTEAEIPSKTIYILFLIVGLFIPIVGVIASLIYYFSVKRPLDQRNAGVV